MHADQLSAPESLVSPEVLDGGDVLPGFTLKLAMVWSCDTQTG